MPKKTTTPNDWDKYLTKDLSETEPYKSTLGTLNYALSDLEWIKIGIGKSKTTAKVVDNDECGGLVYPHYKNYPDVVTAWPSRLNGERKENPVLVFKRKSNQKVYLTDIANTVFKLKEYQDQIERNFERLDVKEINGSVDKLPLFKDLDKEIQRLKDFSLYLVDNRIEEFIQLYYHCIKVIPLDLKDIFKPKDFDRKYNSKLKQFYMLIYQDGTYKVLSIHDIQQGREDHLKWIGKNKYVKRRIPLVPNSYNGGITTIQLNCEKIVSFMPEFEEPEEVINNFYYYTIKRKKVEIGHKFDSFREHRYYEMYRKRDMTDVNRYFNNLSQYLSKNDFQIIHVDEMDKYTKHATVYLRRIYDINDTAAYFNDYYPIDKAEKTHKLLPKLDFGESKEDIKIIGFDLVAKDL